MNWRHPTIETNREQSYITSPQNHHYDGWTGQLSHNQGNVPIIKGLGADQWSQVITMGVIEIKIPRISERALSQ